MVRPFDLNLRHLRSLSEMMENRTLSAAATKIGLSQPALTQGIAKLERQLGVNLFDRAPGRLQPTVAGTALASRAGAAFARLATACRAARRPRGLLAPEKAMTATQLDAFLRVVEAGGFAPAARRTGQSQPALHRAVRDLENIVGSSLLKRESHGVVLTAGGRRIARAIRLAEAEIAAGILELAPDAGLTGRVTIGAMPMSRAIVLPRALAKFTREAPGVRVEVIEGSWRELIDPLLDGIVDIMVGALRDEAPAGVEQRPMFLDRLSVIGRAGHPLASVSHPGLADLTGYPWIVGSDGSPLAAHFDALFGSAPPSTSVSCGSVMVIRGMLAGSDLLTLLSPDQVALEIAAGMLTTIGPPLPSSVRTIGITTRAGWRPTTAQSMLVDQILSAGATRKNE